GAALQRGSVLRGGTSMDQVLAAHFDDQTAQPSLVLGCEQPITGYHETNFSMAYSSHISWQNASSPVPMEVYPALAFDSLFDNQGSRRNQSILDRVSEQARALNQQVSHADRAKLDEYLTGVRLAHHPASHEDDSDAYERVTRYYVGQLAYLAARLAAMPEGESTVLDNSCLMFISNLWSGTRHDSRKVPLLLVGGLGGTLPTGRVLDYTDRGDGNRKLCS